MERKCDGRDKKEVFLLCKGLYKECVNVKKKVSLFFGPSFRARKLNKRKNEYLDFLLRNMYHYHYLPALKSASKEETYFKVGDENEYIQRWKNILRIDMFDIIHLIMDGINLSLPGHQRVSNIEKYYELNQNIFLIRHLQYPLLSKNFLSKISLPFIYVQEEINEIKYCELGAGIPHGLLSLIFLMPEIKSRIKSVEIFDYDLIYRQVTENMLNGLLPQAKIFVNKTRATKLPKLQTKPNFFYAKDVFEHLHKPADFLSIFMEHMEEDSILCVDIMDREKEPYQHVSFDLSKLAYLIRKKGYFYVKKSDNMDIYARGKLSNANE